VNPFTGPEWEGWEVIGDYAFDGVWEIYDDGVIAHVNNWVAKFPNPDIARQIVKLIEAARDGKPIPTLKDVAELVEVLYDLAYGGVDDFGGAYVNLQVDREDIAAARLLLEKYQTKAEPPKETTE
jgi:hypothetical protein